MKRQSNKDQPSRAALRSARPIPQASAAQIGGINWKCPQWVSTPAFEWSIVVALLICHAALAFGSSLYKSVTYDEPIHLLGGLSYWTHNDYRINPENGNLPQRMFAIPVMLFGQYQLPPASHPGWKTSDGWALADEFYDHMGHDFRTITMLGRSANVLLSVLLCLLVYCWSKHIFGLSGGFLSLVLATFCPNLIAHGRLMTSDTCASLFLLASTASVWFLLQRISLRNLLFATIAVSGLFLSKYSAALILPVSAVLTVITIMRMGFDLRAIKIAGCVTFVALATWAIVWMAFGFRFSAYNSTTLPSGKFFKLETVENASERAGGGGKLFQLLNDLRLTPEAWNYGGAFVLTHAKEREAFLAGQFSTTGWWYYFPYGVSIKTPLPVFGLLGLAVVPFLGRRDSLNELASNKTVRDSADQNVQSKCAFFPSVIRHELTPLAVLMVVSWAVFLTSNLNIGIRHVLVTYPILYILAGASVRVALLGRKWQTAMSVLIACVVLESVVTFPHYLSYFNQIVGSKNGWKHLVDSNLDWGQDLPALADYCRQLDTTEPIISGYWGPTKLESHGIRHIPLMPSGNETGLVGLYPAVYCLSATYLQGPYRRCNGPWTIDHEEQFAEVNLYVGQFLQLSAADREVFIEQDQQSFSRTMDVFFELQGHRLCRWLATRCEPDAMAGRSILIYHLDDQEIKQILTAPLDGVSRRDLARIAR